MDAVYLSPSPLHFQNILLLKKIDIFSSFKQRCHIFYKFSVLNLDAIF